MRIVVLADTHIGHNRALTPKSWFNIATNEFQKWVLKQFEDFRTRFYNPDYLVLNGDLADGSQVITLGVDAITTDLDQQEEMAVELIKPIIGNKTKVYGINGSGYHGGLRQGTNMDRRITKALGGEFKGSVFELGIGKELIQFAHGSGGGIVNPDAYIRRELKLALQNSAKNRMKHPTILVRSHGHLSLVSGNSVAVAYMTPCWEWQTTYMIQRTANMTPDIGGFIIDIEDEAKVYPKLYPIPINIIQSMRHFVSVKSQREKEQKKKDKQEIKKLFKNRKL